MTLTLDFQGQIFDSHILGMGRSIDLEWKRCELDTMLDAQWVCSRATVHGKLAKWWVNVKLLLFPTCWPMNGLFIHWSMGWGVLSFSEHLVPSYFVPASNRYW